MQYNSFKDTKQKSYCTSGKKLQKSSFFVFLVLVFYYLFNPLMPGGNKKVTHI